MNSSEFKTEAHDLWQTAHDLHAKIAKLMDKLHTESNERLSSEWHALHAAMGSTSSVIQHIASTGAVDNGPSAFENEKETAEKPWKDATE